MADNLEGSEVGFHHRSGPFVGDPNLRRCGTIYGWGVRQHSFEEDLWREEGPIVDQPDLWVSYEKAGREIASVQVHG